MQAKKILIATPLLCWYLAHGLKVSKIYQVVEFTPKQCFKDFHDEVSHARRAGDADSSKSIIADTMKLIGNSGYGSMIMNKERHNKIDYVKGEIKATMKTNQPVFKKLTELDDELFEIESVKKEIKLDLPIYLGYFILQYAKLRMLEFYFDFVDKYIERRDFQYLETDTDSAYFAISSNDIESIIKPEMKAKYMKSVYHSCNVESFTPNTENWFPRKCCSKHTKYDTRTPGLFKLEASGTEMIALCSKTYILKQDDGEMKYSCKGINKKALSSPMDAYEHVLNTTLSGCGLNKGFRVRMNTVFTYEQIRYGLSYFYCKRLLKNDGVSTEPLDLILTPWDVESKKVIGNKYHPLSNYFPCKLLMYGQTFSSAEEAYRFKLIEFNKIKNPVGVIKEERLSLVWLRIREDIMREILIQKMRSVPKVSKWLKENPDVHLVNGTRNRYWGVGMSEKMCALTDNYKGSNRLGSIWEEIRVSHKAEIETFLHQ